MHRTAFLVLVRVTTFFYSDVIGQEIEKSHLTKQQKLSLIEGCFVSVTGVSCGRDTKYPQSTLEHTALGAKR